MKILVVSLLRLGDILLSTSILKSLKKQHPTAELHILINGQFKSVASLIPFVSKVYTFDRDGIQHILGTADHNLLEAYFRVDDLVESLQAEKYDRVINLTHNRLSGWLTALVNCPNTKGVIFNSSGKFAMGSGWFEYLNDVALTSKENVFHFIDVFHYGTGLTGADRRIELKETTAGIDFAERLLQGRKTNRIVIQACSSESKKTFTPEKWKSVANLIAGTLSDHEIFVLGAPNERESVEEICLGTNSVPVIANLEEAFSLIKRSQLLITSDTSVKHLATATPIKILELSLGSSEFKKTGAYTQGAVIVQGQAACAPCSHRTPCSQPTHICADKISPELISLVASAMLRRDENALRVLAYEFKDEAQILRTQISAAGDWNAYPIVQNFSGDEISQWVDRTSQKMYLQGVHEKTIGEYGTEGIHLKQLLQSIFPDQSWREWVSELKSLEKDVMWFDSELENYLSRLKAILGAMDNGSELEKFTCDLERFCRDFRRSPVLRSYCQQILLALDDGRACAMPFQLVKVLREKLSVAHQRAHIELKLIRSLQSGFMEIL